MKEIELLEMLGVTNVHTFFYYLGSENTNSIMNAESALHLVKGEFERIYNTSSTFPEYEDDFFDYLKNNINRIKRQIDSGILPYPDKRERCLNRLCKIIFDVFEKKINPQPQTIQLSENILNWLQGTISKGGNGKPFIESYNGKLKWLQNKQNARVLLTHENIRGKLSKNEAIEEAPIIFIYTNNQPLELGKNDTRQENVNTTDLRNFLNGLKTRPF